MNANESGFDYWLDYASIHEEKYCIASMISLLTIV